MKVLLITALLTVSSLATADCSLTLSRKSYTSKSALLNGVSVSAKVQDALKTVCNVTYSIMSADDLMKLERIKFEKKMEQLKFKQQQFSK